MIWLWRKIWVPIATLFLRHAKMFRDHVLAKGSVMCIVNADADDMRPIAVHAGESPDEHGIGDTVASSMIR